MVIDEIRTKYLNFYQKHGHAIIPSAPLLPENDSTTLFTGSGMQPLLPYLLGEQHPLGSRLTNSQKCVRSVDIDDVGDNRHSTFFEMLGNWSLGDYYKKEQISWLYTFLTKELTLNPTRIYISVFRGNKQLKVNRDGLSAQIWQQQFQNNGLDAPMADFAEKKGMQGGRIFFYDEHYNWWSRDGLPGHMHQGEPGGPDSEVFWDFGEDKGYHENSKYKNEICHINCSCGRFLEIGNSVFMEYKKGPAVFALLKKKNVDFGAGLERLAMAFTDKPDFYSLDFFSAARSVLEDHSKRQYSSLGEKEKGYFRIILDHLRSAVFLIADGALPGNKDQPYFTRRLLRRAMRYGQKIGISQNFCGDVALAILDSYKLSYPELATRNLLINEEIEKEEKKFKMTLEKGLRHLNRLLSAPVNIKEFGNQVFDLYQSYGFPFELTLEITKEKQNIDEIELKKVYDLAASGHQTLSRLAAQKKFRGGLAESSQETIALHTATHLLQAALRRVLGEYVKQKGSNITKERLRFDFSHSKKLTPHELAEVEHFVNEAIRKQLPVTQQEMSLTEARQVGAFGIFDHKYAERVKVFTIGDPDNYFSKEICGGPHVVNTQKLGHFHIITEEASASGVRRIKAILDKEK